MTHYVGLDVSLKEVSICVMNKDGQVVGRGKVPTDPAQILAFVYRYGKQVVRMVHESGQLSSWLTRELKALGAPVVCIDARLAHKALSARLNKSDKADAEGLAHLARTGWYSEVHIKSQASDEKRILIGSRERLLRMRKDIEGHVRGVLKTFGIRMSTVTSKHHRVGFREQFRAVAKHHPSLATIAGPLIATHETICLECTALEKELVAQARDDELASRFMTVPGVGPIVALSFIATIDNATRFRKSTQVGAYLGLTPKRHQSGEVDYTTRISKRGDKGMRTLLVEAASTLIAAVKRFSPLKAWALRLAARKGFKKAAVATARKLAIILHRIWLDGTTYQWTQQEANA